jgi:DNA-directed RNA polymerase subunit RPC12/RpoP
MEQQQIKCPKCGSNQLIANKKGFSGKKAVAGAVLTGGIGLLAGTIGSNKVIITCLSCGNEFKPGQEEIQKEKELKKQRQAEIMKKPAFWAVFSIMLILFILIFRSCI